MSTGTLQIETAPVLLSISQQAVALADEMDQIRSIYGEECLGRIKSALRSSPDPDWRRTIDAVLEGWIIGGHCSPFDPTF